MTFFKRKPFKLISYNINVGSNIKKKIFGDVYMDFINNFFL